VLLGKLTPASKSVPSRRNVNFPFSRHGPLSPKIPSAPLATVEEHRAEIKLVNPATSGKYEDRRGGRRPGGRLAAATLAELGYKVKCFVFHDSPRRATHRRARAASRRRKTIRTPR